jgi:uncharacterized protein (DUF1697 family)
MTTSIALFRGINVGGRNTLPMADLRDLLQDLGCENVRTFIQSGNAVFRHSGSGSRLAGRIREAILSKYGFEPAVLILTTDHVERAVQSNPFPDAVSDPSKLLLFFLFEAPEHPDLEAIEEIRSDGERFALVGSVAYLHAPDGIARSKLAARVGRALGVEVTARNWRTVTKILEM